MAGYTRWPRQETTPLPSPAARRSAEDVALMVDLCQQQCCELDLTWPGPIPLPPLLLHAGLRTTGFMPTTSTFMLWLAHALICFGWHLWLCFGCALAVLWLCFGCVLAVLWLCFGCALAVLWLCFGCALLARIELKWKLILGGVEWCDFRSFWAC